EYCRRRRRGGSKPDLPSGRLARIGQDGHPGVVASPVSAGASPWSSQASRRQDHTLSLKGTSLRKPKSEKWTQPSPCVHKKCGSSAQEYGKVRRQSEQGLRALRERPPTMTAVPSADEE